MKSKITLLLFALLLTATGCKKTIDPFTGVKIYTRSDFRAGIIYTYTYNSDGTVSVIQKSVGGKTTFQYSGSDMMMSVLNSAGSPTDGAEYTVNKNLGADTSHGLYTSQNYSNAYTYNVNGQVLQQKNYTSGNLVSTVDYLYNTALNAYSVTTTYAGGTHSYDNYSYFTSNANTLGIQNTGQFYLGVQSANLIMTNVQINNANDTTDIITYKYRFNGDNVDTMVSYHRNGLQKDSMAYTYY